jgi:plasmid maintenance system antidote protein VapI
MIQDACRRQYVSEEQFAEELGVPKQRIKIILKSRSITEKTLRRCAHALGLEVECRLVRRKK